MRRRRGAEQWFRRHGHLLRLRAGVPGRGDSRWAARGTRQARAELHAALALAGLRRPTQEREWENRSAQAEAGVPGGCSRSRLSGGSVKILLAAEEAAGVQTLRAIAQSGHRIAGVMTAAVDEPRRATGVRDLARQLGYDVWPARWVREPAFADRIRAEGVDLLLNVHSLYLVDERVLEAPEMSSTSYAPAATCRLHLLGGTPRGAWTDGRSRS